jgi:hypothetical protein
MSALVEGYSLEAEIAASCQAIYWATEPDAALQHWRRLRELIAQRAEQESRQFMFEAHIQGPRLGDRDAQAADLGGVGRRP